MLKAKILMLGPCQSGKTVLSNFLSDSTDTAGAEYQPTQGVRILEFEVPAKEVKSRTGVEVELWDVSGDKRFESCWPAIARDTSGIVFVYNPDQLNHDKDLETWVNYFTTAGIRQDQCVLFSHIKPTSSDRVKSRPFVIGTILNAFRDFPMSYGGYNYFVEQGSMRDTQCYIFSHLKFKTDEHPQSDLPESEDEIAGHLKRITTVNTNLEEDADNVRQAFNRFLATLVTALSEKREEEELSIINQR